jgi:hypothetical protein
MSINRDRGKRTERVIAERLGGKRVGILCGEDVMHPIYSIECKSRMAFAGEKFLQQAESHCEKGKTPIAIVHLHGKNHGNDIVMIRLKDFEAHNGEIRHYEEGE